MSDKNRTAEKNLYNREHYDHVHLTLPKGMIERVRKKAGKTPVNKFIRDAVEKELDRKQDSDL